MLLRKSGDGYLFQPAARIWRAGSRNDCICRRKYVHEGKKNTVDFVYEIYNGDKKLFATDKIAPGSQNTIDMTNYLQSGEYDLIFKVRCFLGDTEVNGTEEPVKVVMQWE